MNLLHFFWNERKNSQLYCCIFIISALNHKTHFQKLQQEPFLEHNTTICRTYTGERSPLDWEWACGSTIPFILNVIYLKKIFLPKDRRQALLEGENQLFALDQHKHKHCLALKHKEHSETLCITGAWLTKQESMCSSDPNQSQYMFT